MHVTVVYESMYGNTHEVAEAIAHGMREANANAQVEVILARDAASHTYGAADLLVVGGPTHGWTMSRASTRHAAVERARRPNSTLIVEPAADGPGVREWLANARITGRAAAFDTRQTGPALLTGRASRAISKQLMRAGAQAVISSQSFLVTKDARLVEGELARATAWGRELVSRLPAPRHSRRSS